MAAWLAKTDPEEAVVISALLDTLRGLAHMHSRKVIHCDVRQRNVLVRKCPGSGGDR